MPKVKILIDTTTGALGYDPSTLHTKREEEVEWTAAEYAEPGSHAFALHFGEASPFDGKTGDAVLIRALYDNATKTWSAKRTIDKNAPLRSYKYKVAVAPQAGKLQVLSNESPLFDECPEICVEC